MTEIKKGLEIAEDLKKNKHPFVLVLYKPIKDVPYDKLHNV